MADKENTLICAGYIQDIPSIKEELKKKPVLPPIGFEQPSKYWRTTPFYDSFKLEGSPRGIRERQLYDLCNWRIPK